MSVEHIDPNASPAEAVASLLSRNDHPITILANAAAYIFAKFDRINWAGFYLYDGQKLVLGPFMGKVACTEIAIGSGVCGSAALRRQTIVVEDVNAFEGHIACDTDSRSELVVPLIYADDTLIGVLDIDSPIINRFTERDRIIFEEMRDIIIARLANRIIIR